MAPTSVLAPLTLGLAFGLAALSRPTFWAFALLAAAAWAYDRLRERRANGNGDRRSLRGGAGPPTTPARHALLVLLGTALVVMPWAARNAIAIGRPIPTTAHGGYTLLLANNPVFWREIVSGRPGATWSESSLATWQRSLEREMTAAGIPRDDEPARDRWMRDKAVRHIREQPSAFLRSAVYRLQRLWGIAPVAGDSSAIAVGLVAAFYLATQSLALLGIVRFSIRFLRRTTRRPTFPTHPNSGPFTDLPDNPCLPPLAAVRPALLLVAAFTAVHAIYWTDARMRAPLIPAVAILAAAGLAGLAPARPGRPNGPET